VPLTVFRVDTAARQAAEREGMEEAARELRYEALRGLAVDAVATAHTLDDQAETVVMKLLRGAWTEGLGGISPEVAEGCSGNPRLRSGRGAPALVAVQLVRPLLGVRRAEVEAFLRERGQGVERGCEQSGPVADAQPGAAGVDADAAGVQSGD
jgi:tRNA(Ile)-lysidine synthase